MAESQDLLGLDDETQGGGGEDQPPATLGEVLAELRSLKKMVADQDKKLIDQDKKLNNVKRIYVSTFTTIYVLKIFRFYRENFLRLSI